MSRRSLLALVPLPLLAVFSAFWWWPTIARWEADKISGAVQADALHQTWVIVQVVGAILALWYMLAVWQPWRADLPKALDPAPPGSRQAWLDQLATVFRPEVEARLGRKVPDWPVRYDPTLWGVGGLCSYPHNTYGPAIIIAPTSSAVHVAATLAHEWAHAALAPGAAHGPAFQHMEDLLGFTEGGDRPEGYGGREHGAAFVDWATPLLAKLPPWPDETGDRPPHIDTVKLYGARVQRNRNLRAALLLGLAVSAVAYVGDSSNRHEPGLNFVLSITPLFFLLAWLGYALDPGIRKVSSIARMSRPGEPDAFIPTPSFLTANHFMTARRHGIDCENITLVQTSPAAVGYMLKLIETAALVARNRSALATRNRWDHNTSARLLPDFGFVVEERDEGGQRVARICYAVGGRFPKEEEDAIWRQLGTELRPMRPLLMDVRLGPAVAAPAADNAARWRQPWEEGPVYVQS